jgi:hypothetical protein
MGFLKFLKMLEGTAQNTTTEQTTTKDSALSPTDFEHLTKEGDLPWGWYTHTKEFTNKINNEYSYFLNMWLESRTKSPLEKYSALKSFVVYLEDTERLCKSKGECFEFWFYETLASKDYIEKRKIELDQLTTNFDELQSNHNKRNKEVSNLDERVIKTLKEHPNILQTDFIKLFDPIVQPDVREKLYWLDKSGKLERTKSGRSYVLHYKE